MTDQPDNPRAVPGDNSAAVTGDELKQFLDRIEKLEEEKVGVAGDIKDVFTEAKGRGFDTKAMREILRARKQDPAERQEHYAIVRLYGEALGFNVFD